MREGNQERKTERQMDGEKNKVMTQLVTADDFLTNHVVTIVDQPITSVPGFSVLVINTPW